MKGSVVGSHIKDKNWVDMLSRCIVRESGAESVLDMRHTDKESWGGISAEAQNMWSITGRTKG